VTVTLQNPELQPGIYQHSSIGRQSITTPNAKPTPPPVKAPCTSASAQQSTTSDYQLHPPTQRYPISEEVEHHPAAKPNGTSQKE